MYRKFRMGRWGVKDQVRSSLEVNSGGYECVKERDELARSSRYYRLRGVDG